MIYPELTHALFDKLRDFIYEQTAISLSDRKFSLVQSRLQRRLKALSMSSFEEYYKYLSTGNNTDEIALLIDAISTNVTSFFREDAQWVFLKNNIEQLSHWHDSKRKLRVWSSACSSGQEPYSIAMFLLENLPNAAAKNIKILATDISGDILKTAMQGVYSEKDVGDIPAMYKKYFTKEQKGNEVSYKISSRVKDMILFRQFNLTRGNFAMFRQTDFDMVFCRNVMIYFDTPTKEVLFHNFHHIMRPDTWLFLGHSESMSNKLFKEFKILKSSIYKRL